MTVLARRKIAVATQFGSLADAAKSITCGASDYRDRLTWIKALTRKAL
jgi:hypothetical protein